MKRWSPMAARRTTFGKLERDRAKKAKAASKRERREERLAAASPPDPAPPEVERLTQAEVFERLTRLHERFDDGDIAFEEFEKQKSRLLECLALD